MAKNNQQPNLADDLLAAARSRGRRTQSSSWFDRLAPEHQAAVVDARDRWRESGGSGSAITGTALAASMIESFELLGYKMPSNDSVRRWLVESK
jgi:hypothetical protein